MEPYKRNSSSSSILSDDSLAEKGLKGLEDQPTLKLFESRLAHERKGSSPAPSPAQPSFVEISGPLGLAGGALSRTRQGSKPNIFDHRRKNSQVEDAYQERLDEAQMRSTPEFKRYEETTNIELFYDLFFIANLTTFTATHDINEVPALKSYAGFFFILWFLWVQVGLFDVRFVQDSILERVGKAAQSGVMVGLSIVGTDFNLTLEDPAVFKSIALVLMVSRIVLAFQYLSVLREVWNYEHTKLPLILVVTVYFGAALIYLGTFFGFQPNSPANGQIFNIWLLTALSETAVNIAVSSQWEVLTFAGTHLIKRMSLLTLIILGEGVIGISKAVSIITKQEEHLTPALLGTITSGVVIIYFSYMLYFDSLKRNHFGSFREGLWALLHFPFHLALVLLVEGTSQFILWRKVVEVVAQVNRQFATVLDAFNGDSSVALAQVLSNVTNDVFAQFKPESRSTVDEAQRAISAIDKATFNSTEQDQKISTLFAVIQDSLFENFGIEAPPPMIPPRNGEEIDPNEVWQKNMGAFILVFQYFFVAAGATLILMNALHVISRCLKTKGDYGRVFINLAVGIVLISLAGVANTSDGITFAQSPWILPSVALSFLLVMLLTYSKVVGGLP